MRLVIKHVIKRPRHYIKRLLLRSNVEVRLPTSIGGIALVLVFRENSVACEGSKFNEAATQLTTFRTTIESTAEALKAVEPWSLFDRDNHDAHFAAVRALNRASIDPRTVRARRADID
jgi:hypothetical protein